MLKQIAIVGVGLIGVSFALAMRRVNPGLTILGLDHDVASLSMARQRGAIDGVATAEQAARADLIVLAIPVRQMSGTLAALQPHLAAHTVIIDTGSTKQDVIAAARATLGPRAPQFVACHPIAGSEQHGAMAGAATLFDGKSVVMCVSEDNNAPILSIARAAWRDVGATVIEMPAALHDAVFAAVSHLPHMLAFVLVDELASRPNAKLLFEHAASGFRDFTRIASSSPVMWCDVAMNNRAALLSELDVYIGRAVELRRLLADADEAQLFALMQRAQQARERWLAGQLDEFNDPSV